MKRADAEGAADDSWKMKRAVAEFVRYHKAPRRVPFSTVRAEVGTQPLPVAAAFSSVDAHLRIHDLNPSPPSTQRVGP